MSELYQQVMNTDALQGAKYTMASRVTELYDYMTAPIPEELRPLKVTDADVDRMVAEMAARHQQSITPDAAEKGDCVICQSLTDGVYGDRKVLLYPGLSLPGAEDAEDAALGKSVGDEVDTVLCDTALRLRITGITRVTCHAADDDMVRSEGIEGVTTLSGYRTRCAEQLAASREAEAARKLAGHIFPDIVAKSVYEVDEAEKQAWLYSEAQMKFDLQLRSESPEALTLRDDPEKLQAKLAEVVKESEQSFQEHLIYRAIAAAAGVTFGIHDAAEVIAESAKAMKMDDDFDKTMAHVNMHYLLEVCWMQRAVDVLVGQLAQRL